MTMLRILIATSALLVAVSVSAQMPGAQSERFNELITEMAEAQKNGDTKRISEIGKELEALASGVQQEFQQIQNMPEGATSPFYNPQLQVKETPEIKLGFAARKGDIQTVKELVKAGAQLNVFSFDPGPPLMEAASQGHIQIAEFLLANGAKLQVKNGFVSLDALRFAAEAHEDNSDMLRLLIKHGALQHSKTDSMGSALVKEAEKQGAGQMNARSDQLIVGSALSAAVEKNRSQHFSNLQRKPRLTHEMKKIANEY